AENWSAPSFYRHWRANTAGARPGNKAGKDNVENYSCVDRIITTDHSATDIHDSERKSDSGKGVLNEDLDSGNQASSGSDGKPMRRRVSYCVRPYKQL